MPSRKRQFGGIAPRAVVVHSLDHARCALAAARTLRTPVALRSAEGAARYAGAGWFAAMIRQAKREFPDVAFTASLDCGDDAGYAMSAFREGIALVRVRTSKQVRDKLASIARKSGAKLDEDRAPALDLLSLTNPDAALCDWLGGPI